MFNLYDIGAPVTERRTGGWHERIDSNFDDTNAFQQTSHYILPSDRLIDG